MPVSGSDDNVKIGSTAPTMPRPSATMPRPSATMPRPSATKLSAGDAEKAATSKRVRLHASTGDVVRPRAVMTDDGEGYGRNCRNQREMAQDCMRQYRLDWSCGDQVMDVGCANGGFTAEILELCPNIGHVTGIDISAEMIRTARKTHADERITYEVADIGQASSFKSEWLGKFDKVLSFNTMHWVHDQKTALANMQTLLKPGGQILLVMVGKSHQPTVKAVEKVLYDDKWWDYCGYSRRQYEAFRHPWRRHFQTAERPERYYASLARRAGFTVHDSVVEYVNLPRASRAELTGAFKMVLPMVQEIPTESQDQFMNEFMDTFTEAITKVDTDLYEWLAGILIVRATVK